MADQEEILEGKPRDGCEVPDRVVRHFGEQARVHSVRPVRPEHQRVAVRSALRYHLRSHHAVRAAAVLDHNLLAPRLGQLLPDDARQDIRWSARAEGNYQSYGPRGILRGRGKWKE